MGFTRASFHLEGNFLYKIEVLIILVKAKTECLIPNFRKKALISSMPQALVLIVLTTLIICSSFTSVKENEGLTDFF